LNTHHREQRRRNIGESTAAGAQTMAGGAHKDKRYGVGGVLGMGLTAMVVQHLLTVAVIRGDQCLTACGKQHFFDSPNTAIQRPLAKLTTISA